MTATPLVPNHIGQLRYPRFMNVETGIVATPSGVQATALKLTAQLNRVDTVATTADAVALPKASGASSGLGAVGTIIFIQNNGAAALQLFGQTPDTINAVATATGIAVTNAKSVMVALAKYTKSTDVGEWITIAGA